MKFKSVKAWAVIKKKKKKINALDIFANKDVQLGDDELIIRVEIKQIHE